LHWRFGLARRSRIVRVYFHKARVSPLTERSGTSTLSEGLESEDVGLNMPDQFRAFIDHLIVKIFWSFLITHFL
jgi:hypothetical protein